MLDAIASSGYVRLLCSFDASGAHSPRLTLTGSLIMAGKARSIISTNNVLLGRYSMPQEAKTIINTLKDLDPTTTGAALQYDALVLRLHKVVAEAASDGLSDLAGRKFNLDMRPMGYGGAIIGEVKKSGGAYFTDYDFEAELVTVAAPITAPVVQSAPPSQRSAANSQNGAAVHQHV